MSSGSSTAVLAIDTAGDSPAIALAAPCGVLTSVPAKPEGRGRGERLTPTIEAILKDANLRIDQLAGLAVVTGPGSYTGLRVGLALVRGLALRKKLPVIGMGALELLARLAPTSGPVVAVLAAGNGRAYAAGFESQGPVGDGDDSDDSDDSGQGQGASVVEAWDPGVFAGDEFLERLADGPAAPCVVGHASSLAELFGPGEQAAELAKLSYTCVDPAARPALLASVSASGIERGEGVPASSVLPMYVGRMRAVPNRNRVVLGAQIAH